MPLKYDKLFNLLKEKGWNTTRIRKENLIGQATLTALRNNTGGLDHRTIAKICDALDCQPSDIMEFIPDNEQEPEQTQENEKEQESDDKKNN